MQAEKKEIQLLFYHVCYKDLIDLINLIYDYGYLLVAIKYEVWANSFEALTS